MGHEENNYEYNLQQDDMWAVNQDNKKVTIFSKPYSWQSIVLLYFHLKLKSLGFS